jgi:DNA invertase Pin-like site-specific DNA recombinase
VRNNQDVTGTRVGYARCSTDEQDVIVQTEQQQQVQQLKEG